MRRPCPSNRLVPPPFRPRAGAEGFLVLTSGDDAMKWRVSNGKYGFFLNIPGLLIVLLWVVFPAFLLFYTSFFRLDNVHPVTFNGIANYKHLWNSRVFWISLDKIALFSLGSTALTFFGGLSLALCLAGVTRGGGLLRSLMIVPWAVPAVISGLIWKWMFSPDFGVISDLLMKAGLIGSPLSIYGNQSLAMWGGDHRRQLDPDPPSWASSCWPPCSAHPRTAPRSGPRRRGGNARPVLLRHPAHDQGAPSRRSPDHDHLLLPDHRHHHPPHGGAGREGRPTCWATTSGTRSPKPSTSAWERRPRGCSFLHHGNHHGRFRLRTPEVERGSHER